MVEDEITRPGRIAVENWAKGHEEFSFRERIDYAINCGACTSIYAGMIVLGLSQFRAGQWIVRVLAASGAALGWMAVLDKLEDK